VFLLVNSDCSMWVASNTHIMVFVLTRPGIEPTILQNRDEHINHLRPIPFNF